MKIPILLVALLLTSLWGQAQKADEASIKEVIEAETKAFGNRMADKVMSYWAHTPYISHSMEVISYESLSDAMLKVAANNPSIVEYQSAVNSDYNIRVNGTSAWVTFIQERQTSAGKARARQARYLEKLDGQWKLVAVLTDDEVPPLTERNIQAMVSEYEQGPTAYFKKYCTPDYIFIGSEGEAYTLDQTLELLKKAGSEKVSMQYTDLKIRHYGKTAIVTGINTSTYQVPAKPAKIYKDRFTYTYLYDGSQWKWTSAQHVKLDYSTGALTERK